MNGDIWLLICIGALLLANIAATKRIRELINRLEQIQRMLATELRERDNNANNANG